MFQAMFQVLLFTAFNAESWRPIYHDHYLPTWIFIFFKCLLSFSMQCVFVSCLKEDFDICVHSKITWFCRWLLTPQTRRMLNLQGPKTEKENAAGPENGIVNPHRLVNGTAPAIGIALNLLKGSVKVCFYCYGYVLYFCSHFLGVESFRDRRMKDREKERDRDRSRKDRDGHRRDKDRGKRSRFVDPTFFFFFFLS